MGKVRTETVKRVTLELVDKYPRSFTTDFEQNKQFLNEIGLEVSKKLRNRIAGYISRVIRSELEYQEEGEEEPEEQPVP